LFPSTDAWQALSHFAAATGMTQPKMTGNSVEDLYQAESAMLQTQRIVPLLHLPVSYAVSPIVKAFSLDRDGRWQLPDVWLGKDKP